MKKIIALFLIARNFSFGQSLYIPEEYPSLITPTKFDEFIIQPDISWAAYNYDKLSFPKINLNELLRKRFDKAEIKVSYSLWPGNKMVNEIEYLNKEQVDDRFYPMCDMPIFDSAGNIRNTKKGPKIPVNRFDSLSANLTYATQIFYVQNNKLRSCIVWVTPATSIYTSMDVCLGTSDYFTTAFNYNYDFKPAKKDDVIFLGETNRLLKIDSVADPYLLKQLYGRNLLESIWPGILNKTIEIFSVETNKKLLPGQLTDYIFSGDFQTADVHDTVGTMTNDGRTVRSISLPLFKDIELKQLWYYDLTKNIVFTSIPQIVLWAKKYNNGIQEKETKPLLKIVLE